MAYKHQIIEDRCKGCGLCVNVCPKNVLEISKDINTKGYFPAYQARPDVAIAITEIEEEAAAQK